MALENCPMIGSNQLKRGLNMAKLKPLGSMAFGQITFNEEKLEYALKKSSDREKLKNWIDKTLAESSEKYNAGYYLIFIKLNPRRTRLFLRLDTEKYRDENGNIVIPDFFNLVGH